MELQQLGKKELAKFLEEQVDLFRELPKPDQDRLVSMAQVLIARSFPESFVLKGVASTASVMEDLRHAPGDIMESEHVRRFIRENSIPEERHIPREPARETKREEREQFLESITSIISEARSVKSRHEIKKMRRVLLGIDQRCMRQVLGRDADEPLREIRQLLNEWAPIFASDTT